MNYNHALLQLANEGLQALADSNVSKKGATAAQESHFLCNWMAEALKQKRFPKAVADNLTTWVRQGRTLGANAHLKTLLQRIQSQYSAVIDKAIGCAEINAWLDELRDLEFLVITDAEVTQKLKLDNDGLPSAIISATQFNRASTETALSKPVVLYIRADETIVVETAFKHGLLLSEGDKKGSLIKHHKAYTLYPNNAQPALGSLLSSAALPQIP